MNSGYVCRPCKRSFVSLKEFVTHTNKRQCVANAALDNLMNTSASQNASTSVVSATDAPTTVQSVVDEPAPSNISSPMAAPSPMNEDMEQETGNINLTTI